MSDPRFDPLLKKRKNCMKDIIKTVDENWNMDGR